MRSRLIVVALAALAAPLHAQTSVETGGGVARLDHFAGGAFSTFRASINQNYAGMHFTFANTTTDHRGLGTAYRTDLLLQTPFYLGAWDLHVGPQLHLAKSVDVPNTRTFGVNVVAQRNLGRLAVTTEYQQGLAWYGHQHNQWLSGEVRLNSRVGPFRIGSSLRALVMMDSVARTDVSFDLRDPRVDTLYRKRVQQINDLGLTLGWKAGRVSFDGRLGERFGSQVHAMAWWEGNLAIRVASSLSVTFGSSLLPADQLLRLHGGHYTTLGLRLSGSPPSGFASSSRERDPLAVEVIRPSLSTVSLRFAIPGARSSAFVSGEFSNWQPVELKRMEDGRWEATISATAGIYRMNIRADGGAWSVPPGLRSVADDFGGVVGLLVVQ